MKVLLVLCIIALQLTTLVKAGAPSKEVVKFVDKSLSTFVDKSLLTNGIKYYSYMLKERGLSPLELAVAAGLPQLESLELLQSTDLSFEINPQLLVIRTLKNHLEEEKRIFLEGHTPNEQIKAHLDSIGEELDNGMKLWQIVVHTSPPVFEEDPYRGGTRLAFRQLNWDLYHVYAAVLDYVTSSEDYQVSVDGVRGIKFSTVKRRN